MLAFIRGKLTEFSQSFAILETSGVGYKIFIPVGLSSKFTKIGEELLLHVSFVVRDFSQTLYGFFLREERDLFEELITISGIGPKLALSLIGHLPIPDFYLAIYQEDPTLLSQVPGVGKKLAERIFPILRQKLNKEKFQDLSSNFASHAKDNSLATYLQDAFQALTNLGYNRTKVENALKKTLKENPKPKELSTFISLALKNV